MLTAFDIWLVLLGPVIASFVTALADRSCADRPLLSGRSHCFECGATVRPRDLVPLLSWPLLKGRCRNCHARIAPHLWAGEFAGLGLAAIAIWIGNTPAESVLVAVWFWVLLGLFQADRQCERLPDILTASLFVVGALLGGITIGWLSTMSGAALGVGSLWLISAGFHRLRGHIGLGPGDIKMMAGIGAAIGPLGLPWVTLIAALSAIGTAVLFGDRGEDWRRRRVAFGCHLAIAAALVLAFGP